MLIATRNAWHADHVCMAAQGAGILALIVSVIVVVAVLQLLCICHPFVRKNMCIP